MVHASRRDLMTGAAAFALALPSSRVLAAQATAPRLPTSATPIALKHVRLRPSDFATAVEVNRLYLLQLSADRLLHSFRSYAGLKPKGEIYGGWESETIAGHTLGHYMSALVAAHEQTGCPRCKERADYVVDELAAAQHARGNGYFGAMQRKRSDGTVVDAEEIFPEIMKGDIHSSGFDLNGAWSPLYTVHKLFAGLLDIHGSWGNPKALTVLLAFGGYFEKVFAALDERQLQTLLACEYGGLNESFAELSVRTGDPKWLSIAKRLYDHKSLDPLTANQDVLANTHANTLVPKVIGLARIHEITGDRNRASAARFFWDRVARHHSFVIGGNGDREYFFAPDATATHVTEQTCEHCSTYNMLKLTRHIYAWRPDGALFDFYERAHLNHVMAAHNPKSGGFTYMTPLLAGSVRHYSNPKDDPFWCCVGTGMESHAKHGDSIYWEAPGTLLVNLYVPSTVHWTSHSADLELETNYPFEPTSRLRFVKLARPARFAVALRVPAFANGRALVCVNARPVLATIERGYAIIERRWRSGDEVAITLPLDLRLESAPGDADTVAVMRGPMVLAADLASAKDDWDKPDPALVGDDLLANFRSTGHEATFIAAGVARPTDLTFVPFYRQYERRSAVYFKRFSEAGWKTEQAGYFAEQAHRRDIAARSVDVMHLGEMQAERDHGLISDQSYPVTYRGRNGRDARTGGFFEFTMKVKPGPVMLEATYWGDERDRDFDLFVDDVKIATQHLGGDAPGKFIEVQYPLPVTLTSGKPQVRVKFVPHDRSTAGPVFAVVLFTTSRARPSGK